MAEHTAPSAHRPQRWLERKENGVIAMEATISMTLFVFLVLALYSLITLFMAQSMIGHALIQSSESLALETFSTDQLGDGWGTGQWISRLVRIFDTLDRDSDFVSDDLWYKETYGSEQDVLDICEQRFYLYLAGSEEKGKSILRVLRVDDLDFSDTKLNGNDLTIAVSYRIKLLFGIDLGIGSIQFNEFQAAQSVCARIWGNPKV